MPSPIFTISLFIIFFNIYLVFVWFRGWMYTCVGIYIPQHVSVEVRGHLLRVTSLPPCGFQWSNSGHWTWQQVTTSNPCRWPLKSLNLTQSFLDFLPVPPSPFLLFPLIIPSVWSVRWRMLVHSTVRLPDSAQVCVLPELSFPVLLSLNLPSAGTISWATMPGCSLFFHSFRQQLSSRVFPLSLRTEQFLC